MELEEEVAESRTEEIEGRESICHGKSYSSGLRKQIIQSYRASKEPPKKKYRYAFGNLSNNEIADKYGVSRRFVQKLIKQYKDSGGKENSWNRNFSSGRKKIVEQGDYEIITRILQDYPDITIKQLHSLFVELSDNRISQSTIWRVVRTHPLSKINPVNKLKSLPGIDRKLAELLVKVGICSTFKLKKMDPYDIYELFKRQFKRTTRKRVFQIERAIRFLNESKKNRKGIVK